MKFIKIGFVIGSTKNIAAWYFETIKNIAEQNNIEIYFLVKSSQQHSFQKQTFSFRLFTKFEDWWFQSEYDANKQVNIEYLLKDSNTIYFAGDWLSKNEDLSIIQKKQLDIIYTIDFAFLEKENISQAAKYGLWHIQFGYGNYYNQSATAFWEVMDDSPIVGSYLLARKNGRDQILYEGTTVSVPYSRKNTFNSIAWKSSSYLLHRVKECIQSGKEPPFEFTEYSPKVFSKKQLPGNAGLLFLFVRNIFRYALFKLNSLKKDRFTLLLSFQSFQFKNYKREDFLKLDLPKNSFYADPFVIEKNNIHYLFFEEFLYSKNKAHISMMEVNAGKKISTPKIVLEKDYHLSYPFAFFHNGEYYMVPDTANNKVELYKAKNFPDDWEFVMNLIEGELLIDVTLHLENGVWWLFANSFNHPFVSTNDQLFLFYSKELYSSSWIPHPKNPVATHISNCRPAGRVFRQNGKLYRPAQNNGSKQYGYGLKINEVIVLNKEEYQEREVYSFSNDDLKLKACHNIDFTGSITVIDGIPK